MMRRSKLFTLWSFLPLLLLPGCMEDNEDGNDGERVREVPVETMGVERASFDDYIRVTGIVEALEDATISSENSGRIQSILERGATVRRGEVIARMDERLSRSQYEAARTSFELAEDTYNRMKALHDDEIISTQDYRSARARMDQARAQMEQAEKQLRDTNVEAPFSGRVEDRYVRQGELINPGMPVARVVNTERVRVVAGIPERYSGQVTDQSQAFLRFRALNDREIESQVSFAGNLIDPDTRTFTVEVELPNGDGRLKPEMVADMRVKRSSFEDAVIIPRTAVVRDETSLHVFRVAEENGYPVAQLVEVQTGFTSGGLIEITAGLDNGDEVVVTGLSNLNMGDRLNILSTMTNAEKVNELQTSGRYQAGR